ncbi:MAG: hypothetical protein WC936_06460 [Candidatus Nanoarchaeia archaeon]|jgi:hypothetical protein
MKNLISVLVMQKSRVVSYKAEADDDFIQIKKRLYPLKPSYQLRHRGNLHQMLVVYYDSRIQPVGAPDINVPAELSVTDEDGNPAVVEGYSEYDRIMAKVDSAKLGGSSTRLSIRKAIDWATYAPYILVGVVVAFYLVTSL